MYTNFVHTVRDSMRRRSLGEKILRVDPANRSQVEQMKRELRKKIEKYPGRSFTPEARIALRSQNYELARFISATKLGEIYIFLTFIRMNEYQSGNYFELAKHFYDTGNQDVITRYIEPSEIDSFMTPFFKRTADEIFDGRNDDANALLLAVMSNRITSIERRWPNKHVELCIWLLLRANEFGPDAFKERPGNPGQLQPEIILFLYISHVIITLYTRHIQGNIYEGQIETCRILLCEMLSSHLHLHSMVERLLLDNNLHIDPMSICLPVANATVLPAPPMLNNIPNTNQQNVVGYVAPTPQMYSTDDREPVRMQEVVPPTNRPRTILDTLSAEPLAIWSHPGLSDLTRYNSWEMPPSISVPNATVVPESAIMERERSNPAFHVSDPNEPGVRLQKRAGGYNGTNGMNRRMKSKTRTRNRGHNRQIKNRVKTMRLRN